MRGLAFIVASAWAVASGVALAQDLPRVLSARDTIRINEVGSPTLSPDGNWVLYTVRARDMDDDDLEALTHIWRARLDGTDNRQLTRGPHSATSPAWSPDRSHIAFLAARGDGPDESRQVYLMRADGGEAWQATAHDEAISSFLFSPDGAKLLLTSRDALPADEKKRRDAGDDAEVVDGLYRMTHLWVHDLETEATTRLTEGDMSVANPDWAPDSSRVVFEMRPNPTHNDRWRSDIWVANVATGETRRLHENGGSDTGPRWSPDGRTIAFAGNPDASSNTMYNKLYLVPASGGDARILLEEEDRDFSTPIWSPDGRRIFWVTGVGTSTGLFSVSIESGGVASDAAPGGRNSQWELSNDGTRWIWVHTSPDWPSEIYTAMRTGGEPVRLTDANAWLREEDVQLGVVETVRWENSDGQIVEGVLTRPVGYEEGRAYPFIVNPHGGPTGASLEAFNSSAQFFAGNGYVVLQPNFRGSTNYGQAFVNANIDNWGIADYDDVMTGVEHAVAEGLADPDRLICYGWSYGGYMSAWVATQTDRFKAISPGAGLTNLYSMYSTNDIQDYLASFFGGTPWVETDNYRDHSPMTYVANVTTPVLLLHGGSDTRVPPEQSVEFYKALKDLGKDVTFVRFPREGHGLAEPRHLMDRLRRYAEYFGEHVDNPPISESQPHEADDEVEADDEDEDASKG